MSDLAQGFFERFRGLMRAHGQYLIPRDLKPNAKGKMESPQNMRKTIIAPVTAELWTRHLDGSDSIGIVPIDDNAQIHWAAIDVDDYNVDHDDLNRRIAELDLPLIVCRTKSGGAHLYLFMKRAVSADLVREKLLEWALALGYRREIEIFPKQIKLANGVDTGNWLNMPYQNVDHTTRYAVRDGRILSAFEFLNLAERLSITGARLKDIKVEFKVSDEARPFVEGAPPCLEYIAMNGESNYRNNALFSFCIYYRRRFPSDWETRIVTVNKNFMEPPLSDREIRDVIASVKRKEYGYKCKDQPIVSYCNKEMCLKREYGVGTAKTDPGILFGSLTKIETDPPTWIWCINAVNIELTTEQLLDQRLFGTRVVETLNRLPNLVKGEQWMDILETGLQSMQVVEVPEDATRQGQLMVHLHRYCTSRVVGHSLDELLLGKPYTDEERTYFVAADFLQYLQQHRVSGVDVKRLFTWLREHDAKSHRKTIKGKAVAYWSVPKFTAQVEEFDVPRKTEQEAM